MPEVSGFVAPGYDRVADAFARNFATEGEIGAAFAAMRDGVPVVDLWGGIADEASGRRWDEDTTAVIFSGTKALVAMCLLVLVDQGRLDPGAPVTRYWPEFGAHGKDGIRVTELVSHRARLPGLEAIVSEVESLDARRMAEMLASQAPVGDPRAAFVYHPLTWGWLAGELLRRIDGRSVGAFFHEEIATPLELDVWIGLPAEHEQRVATLRHAEDWAANSYSPADFAADPLLAATWRNPDVFGAGQACWNGADFHAAEIPGAGAIAEARSMARLYGCLAGGGELDGVRLLSGQALDLGRRCLVREHEQLADKTMAFGFGFQLQTDDRQLGAPADAFGHSGLGGTLHGAWPAQGVGFSYCPNLLRNDAPVDPRTTVLLGALHQSLAAC